MLMMSTLRSVIGPRLRDSRNLTAAPRPGNAGDHVQFSGRMGTGGGAVPTDPRAHTFYAACSSTGDQLDIGVWTGLASTGCGQSVGNLTPKRDKALSLIWWRKCGANGRSESAIARPIRDARDHDFEHPTSVMLNQTERKAPGAPSLPAAGKPRPAGRIRGGSERDRGIGVSAV